MDNLDPNIDLSLYPNQSDEEKCIEIINNVQDDLLNHFVDKVRRIPIKGTTNGFKI
jgi:hypothetical protein